MRSRAFSVSGLVACALLGLACGEAPDSPSAAGVQRASLEVASLLELTLPDARTNDFFGKAVALDGDQALVGVIGRDSAADAGDDVGSAQLFERAGTTWKATDELFPSERVPQAQLGWAVAIRGETAALASATATAPAADTGDPDVGYAGLVYGFRKVAGRWAPQRLELDASALVEDRLFGYALAALDDEIFVGSPSSGQPGSVNVYHWQNGAFELKQALERPASAEVADDGFGWSLAATDDTVLVGAAGNPGAAGFVYVYSRDKAGAWQLEQTLRQKRHEETVGDYFGVTVSVEGDIALVGAAGNSDNNVAGGVYIFERADGKWGEDFTHELLPPTPSSFADGLATAIGPERIWIGSLGMPNGAGAVQPVSLRNREWQLDDQINPPTPDVEGFGLALAASGRSVLIGSDGDARHEGAVYVATELDGASCETDSDCSSGHCADGVCCDSACDSACFSCRASDKDEGPDGECGPVSNAVEPAEGDCATESAETCGQTGRCDGHGECALYKKGTACAAARCTSTSILEPAQSCDGAGECLARAAIECAPQSCRSGAGIPASCAPCRDDGDCEDGQFCQPEGCEVKRDIAAPCTEGRQCQSGMCPADHCVDGPECSADGRERVDADGTRVACGAYICDDNDCRDSCRNSADCQDGFACSQSGRCEAIPSAPPESSGGCGFAPQSRHVPAWIAGALAVAVTLRRRRRTAP